MHTSVVMVVLYVFLLSIRKLQQSFLIELVYRRSQLH